MDNLYYWFVVGEGTLPLHHLISEITPKITPKTKSKSAQSNQGKTKKGNRN
jgi:hypothetical protein